jgi:Tfp pilus assembly protein PilF
MIKSLNDLGLYYQSAGKHEKAERACRRAVHLAEKFWGTTHAETVRSLNTLGACLVSQAKLEEAQQCFERALELAEKVKSLPPRYVAGILDNLSNVAATRALKR